MKFSELGVAGPGVDAFLTEMASKEQAELERRRAANARLRQWFEDNPLPGTLKRRNPMSAAQIRKTIAALIGAVTSAVSLGLLPDPASKYVTIAVAFLTALGVYAVPNEGA